MHVNYVVATHDLEKDKQYRRWMDRYVLHLIYYKYTDLFFQQHCIKLTYEVPQCRKMTDQTDSSDKQSG